MGPTPKQKSYLQSLMVDKGHAHAKYGPNAGAKAYTTVRQRQSWDAFFGAMTVREASELIDRLKN